MQVELIYKAGSSEKRNEDQWLAQDNRFAVFDGMTDLMKYTDPASGNTGGYLASQNTRNVFQRPGNLDALAMTANYELAEMMTSEKVDRKDPCNLWSTSAAVIEINENENQLHWLKVYDSKILLVYEASYKFLGRTHDHDTETLILLKELMTAGHPRTHPDILKKTQEVRRKMNIDYGCINGSSNVGNYIDSGSENLGSLQSIILFTDGLEYPKEDPKTADDWEGFSRRYRGAGLDGLFTDIRALEDSDPDCKKYPRFKTHDDIAAIAVNL